MLVSALYRDFPKDSVLQAEWWEDGKQDCVEVDCCRCFRFCNPECLHCCRLCPGGCRGHLLGPAGLQWRTDLLLLLLLLSNAGVSSHGQDPSPWCRVGNSPGPSPGDGGPAKNHLEANAKSSLRATRQHRCSHDVLVNPRESHMGAGGRFPGPVLIVPQGGAWETVHGGHGGGSYCRSSNRVDLLFFSSRLRSGPVAETERSQPLELAVPRNGGRWWCCSGWCSDR